MKITILQTFYGRPDEQDDQLTMFVGGETLDVPDTFGGMVIEKGLAKAAGSKSPAKKEPVDEAE